MSAEASTLREVLEPFARAALNVYFPEKDPDGHPSLTRFFLENGRLPYLSDEIKPWDYRGWLLAYLLLVSSMPGVEDRWGYHLRTLDAGQLLDEPIPRIEFLGYSTEPTQIRNEILLATKEAAKRKKIKLILSPSETMNKLRALVRAVGETYGFGERALCVFCDWLAWGLGVENEKPTYIKEQVNEMLYRNFDVSSLMLFPYDYLGELLEEMRSVASKKSGFFLTPHHICEFIVRVTFDDGDNRAQTVMEPAVGTGRMLLHSSNHSLRLHGMDIDPVCVKVCKINGALYAPWMILPLPETFFPKDVKPVNQPQTLSPFNGEAKKNRRPAIHNHNHNHNHNRNKNRSKLFALTIEVRACSSTWRNN